MVLGRDKGLVVFVVAGIKVGRHIGLVGRERHGCVSNCAVVLVAEGNHGWTHCGGHFDGCMGGVMIWLACE